VKQAEEKERKKGAKEEGEEAGKGKQMTKKKEKRVNGTRDLGVRFGERLMGILLIEAFWYVIYGPPPVISQFLWLII